MANFPDIRKFAPGIEQLAAIEGISKAGFVAHSILAKHYDREFFEETSSDDLASRLWQEVRLELKLPLERCLGDQRIFQTFTEMLRAHDHGYYQLTVPSGAFVIERVANIAQVSGRKARTPEWFREHVGQLALSELPEWRGWMVLVEHVFGQCYDDETADKMKYPSRHGVAHGRGSRLFGVVDSLNTILLAHIAVGAGVAFVLATRNDCIETPPAYR